MVASYKSPRNGHRHRTKTITQAQQKVHSMFHGDCRLLGSVFPSSIACKPALCEALDVIFSNGNTKEYYRQRNYNGTSGNDTPIHFFEYDENYVSSFPNPSPLLLRFAPGIQQEQSSRFPSFLVDSLPDGWGLLLMDKEFRKQGRALREISYIDRLRYVGNNSMGSLSFSPQESEEFIGKSLEIIGIEKLNQNALAIFEEDSHDVLETLNRIASSGGSRPKGNLYFSKDLRLCNESWQPSFDGWIVV